MLLLLLLLFMVAAAPILTLLRQRPTLAVAVRTWSMSPLLTRGDLVLLLPAGGKTSFAAGQIAVFRFEDRFNSDWTLHRIVGGDPEKGFITRGDANEYADQDVLYPPVRPEWIAGVVPAIGSAPLKIPLLGYVPLLLEANVDNPGLLLILTGALALVLVFDETFKKKKKRRKDSLQKGRLFFLGGLAFALLMSVLMIAGSIFLTFPYGVEETPGALMGSEVGVLELGRSRELVLAELRNEGIIPSYYYVASRDPQVVVEHKNILMRSGDSAQVTATVYAREEGIYQARVIVGMFLPFLPPGLISFLAGINYWLALALVALTPALPVFVLPFLERRRRSGFVKGFRRAFYRGAKLFKN